MQVESEDRFIEEPRKKGLPLLPIVAVAIIAIAAGWFFLSDKEPSSTGQLDTGAVTPADMAPNGGKPATEQPAAPDIPRVSPMPAPTGDTPEETVAAEPPLTLAQSDPLVRTALSPSLEGSVFAAALTEDNLLERATALVDATGNGGLLREVLAIPKPAGKFEIVRVDGEIVTDPANYRRYDVYAESIARLDMDYLATTFHRLRPLLEQAYAGLGYPAEEMDNALIRALDQVIAAPVLDQPAVLEAHVNTFVYQDPELEQLSPLAKQLMRMGPANQAIVQSQAAKLRAALLGG